MNMSQDRQIQNVGGNGGNQFGQYAGQVAQNQQGYNAWQNDGIQVAQNAVQNAGVQIGGNQNGLVVVPGIANQNRTGNVVAARVEGTGNGNQAMCYNCRGLGHIARNFTAMPKRRDASWIQLQAEEFDCMAAAGDLDEIEEVNVNCILMANLQHASTSGTQLDKAPVYDIDGSAEYTDLLEPIPEPQLVPQNDNHVTYVAASMVQSGGTVETSSAPNEETQETLKLAQESREKIRFLKKEIKPANYAKIKHLPGVFVPQTTKSKEELFLSNVSNMVTVSKIISIPNEDLSDDTTPSVARKFLNEVKNSFVTLQRVVKQKMTLEVHNWSSSAHKEVHKIISHEISPIINQVDARVQNFEIQFLQEAAKFFQDFKSLAKEDDESLDKQKSLELEIKRLLKASVIHDIISIVQNGFVNVPSDLQTKLDRTKEKLKLCIIKKEKEYVEWLQAQLRDLKGKSSDTPNASNTLDPLNQKLESKNVELEFQVVNYEREISHLKTTYKNVFDSITSNRAHAKLHNLIYENAKLRARLFENTYESMNNTSGMSMTPHIDKPKIIVVPPYFKKLHVSIPSHSVPQPREFNVVKHSNVIAPEMFKIDPPQTSRVDMVPNKQSCASIRTNPITNFQCHVTFKENVSSDMVNASFIGLVNTAKTRRPHPKGNTRNARVPSTSKSSKVKKNATVEDHRMILLLSKNQKTMSSKCNNIKLAIRNDKSEIVCGTCKQCLVTANHDACLLSPVNALNSRANNLCANASPSANQKTHRTQVWKPKQVGFKERLACKPRLPRFSLKWSPSRRSFDLKGKLVASKETNCPYDDKACTSNPREPIRKWFPNSTVFLGRLSKFVYGTVRFGNDHIASILGYGDLKWGNITNTRVYFVEGKGKRASHPPKHVSNSKQRLHMLHMDLCGPMRVASINEVIKNFLKKICVRLQTPVIIVRTDNGTESKNHALKEYFDSVGITLETSAAKTPQQNGVVGRKNRTLVEAAKTIKLGAKGDIGFFIGYSANSVAYRVYNQRTKKNIETMNVTFDELSAMAFEQNNSRPGLQSLTSGQISSELELTYASSTIIPQRPSERDLNILFELLHNEYLGGRPLEAQEPFMLLSCYRIFSSNCVYVYSRFRTNTNKFLKYFSIVWVKASAKRWYDELSTFLLQNGFSKGIIGPTLFARCFDDEILVVQSNYTNEILNNYGLNTCDIIGTLMDIKDKLDLDQIGTSVDATKYRSMIGALMYLTSSRPDIDSGFELTGFSDADYAGCKDTFKSTSCGA
nr:hypothetical protein [Tanacetum cinerariifolium]